MAGTVGVAPDIPLTLDLITQDPITPELNHTLVAEKFATAQDYADRTYSTALNALADFDNIDLNFDWTPPDNAFVEMPTGLTGLLPVDPPDPGITDIDISMPEFPYGAPDDEIYTVTPVDPPVFNVPLPNFIIPEVPDTEVPAFTAAPPPEETVVIPSPDEIPDLPPLPKLTEVLPPDEPTFDIPSFSATLPVADITPPDLTFMWNEAEYNSEVMSALKRKVLDGIVNGGTGLMPDIEQAIYDRAASRLDVELQKAELLAYTEFSSRGSRLPTGALVARLNEVQLQNTLARTDLTKDVMIKSADLAYDYSKFIIDKGIALEHELISLFNGVQQRAFEAAKVTADFLIREYEVRVQYYMARLEAYKTEAEVFKARISAEIAKADLYRSIIEGRKLSLEMQGLMVTLYSKQVDAVHTMAQIYGIKVEGAKAQVDLYGAKIENFKSLVEAYEAQVNGVTAEYGLYTAQIAGESEKAKMYSYQVDGYKSVVDAYKSRSDIEINNIKAVTEQKRGQIEVFLARLEKYKAEMTAAVTEAEILAKGEDLKLRVYEGKIKKFTAVTDALTDSYKAQTAVAISNAEISTRYGEMLARLETAQGEIAAELIKAKALVASQLASAALSSVSAGASIGYSQSRQDSRSVSARNAKSEADNKSTSKSDSFLQTERNCC